MDDLRTFNGSPGVRFWPRQGRAKAMEDFRTCNGWPGVRFRRLRNRVAEILKPRARRRRPSAVSLKKTMYTLFFCFCLCGPCLSGFAEEQDGRVEKGVDVEATSPIRPSTRMEGLDEAWRQGIDDLFEADVYPSVESAVGALGRKLADAIREGLPEGREGVVIAIGASPDETSNRVSREVGQVLVERSASRPVLRFLAEGEGPPRASESGPQPDISIRIECAWNERADKGKSSNAEGHVAGWMTGVAGEARHEASFVDKPWVDRYSTFVNRHPGRPWILGRSLRFSTSAGEAKEEALRAVASRLAEQVIGLLEGEVGAGFGKVSSEAEKRDLVEHLVAGLRQGDFMMDEFAQRLRRPYGDVWRHAVLVEADARGLAERARQWGSEARAKRAAQRTSFLLMGAAAAVVGLLYFVLNLLTKGYFVWPLRLLSIVTIVTISILVLMVKA